MESSIDKQMAQAIVKDSWRKQRAFTESYLLDKVENQAAAIQRVRAVHVARTRDDVSFCTACVDHDQIGYFQSWPCETIAALDGDTA